jgi:predicted dehydrogenase
LGRYGHGGRPGYEREWRADPGIAGGGQMLDQRVHLIDLARWFAGDFTTITGHVGSFFWDMPVEDNGFAMLRTAEAQVAWLHASCTEWRNLFSFEIFGRNGKSQIDGLGGSYGIERLTYGRMVPEMGPPDTTIWEFPREDQSWQREIKHFVACIDGRASECGSTVDAPAALSIVEEIYKQAGCDYRS